MLLISYNIFCGICQSFPHKILAVYHLVASTGFFPFFSLPFFALTRMPINFYQPSSQSDVGLNMAPSPLQRWPPRPPGSAISTVNILDGRVCGLAQVNQEMGRGGLDLMSLKGTMRMEECFNNRGGYGVSCAVARPSCTSGAHVEVGLGSQHRPNRWGV